MPIVQVDPSTINLAQDLAEFAARPRATEEQIDAWAKEDGDDWTDADIAEGRVVFYPLFQAADVYRLRVCLGLTQNQFSARFGFTAEATQHYETGEETPTGTAATLLRVIAVEPDAVARALDSRS